MGVTRISEVDIYLFNEGTHLSLFNKLGSHPMVDGRIEGTYFAVWAPNARHVYVTGDFNDWSRVSHPIYPRDASGIWEGFIPGVKKGDLYKYHIISRDIAYSVNKADPMALRHELPPRTASIVWDLEYWWDDQEWMNRRHEQNRFDKPMSIYEIHLGSWRRGLEDNGFLNYRDLAHQLAEYVKEMGFTHIELLPIMEHPFYGSWGYQITGYFAPTSRYGTPQDFMYFVDHLHQNGIGVILDWVPSHFPTDQHGPAYFDGTHLYEHSDPRKGLHPDWNSAIFNYGRNEVRSFLLSNALFWVDKYHVDGLRVDAVASMLYLDYSREEGEWIPNEFGGRENIDAISLLKDFNREIYHAHPGIQTSAEESTAWPGVSKPVDVGGLGFGYKWDMGWMHDTLAYLARDPIHRKHHHNELSFRMLYSWTENYILPLSHDEVVHGKGSLLQRMSGDDWQAFANLRLLFGYMFAQPAKKLLFMGDEFAQRNEWYHEKSLDWHLLDAPSHAGVKNLVRDLNQLYRAEPALHELDVDPQGFEWIDADDAINSTLTLLRKGRRPEDLVVAAFNLTPVPRHKFRIGLPTGGYWQEILNTDAEIYGGSGMGNYGGREADATGWNGRPCSLEVVLPPLAAVFFKPGRPENNS